MGTLPIDWGSPRPLRIPAGRTPHTDQWGREVRPRFQLAGWRSTVDGVFLLRANPLRFTRFVLPASLVNLSVMKNIADLQPLICQRQGGIFFSIAPLTFITMLVRKSKGVIRVINPLGNAARVTLQCPFAQEYLTSVSICPTLRCMPSLLPLTFENSLCSQV